MRNLTPERIAEFARAWTPTAGRPALSIAEEIDFLRDLRLEDLCAAIRRYLTRERMFQFYQANTRLFDHARLRKLVDAAW
jgi:hypothetical protein